MVPNAVMWVLQYSLIFVTSFKNQFPDLTHKNNKVIIILLLAHILAL